MKRDNAVGKSLPECDVSGSDVDISFSREVGYKIKVIGWVCLLMMVVLDSSTRWEISHLTCQTQSAGHTSRVYVYIYHSIISPPPAPPPTVSIIY